MTKVDVLETVEWQVKDFADGWFNCGTERGAKAASELFGAKIRELVTRSQAEAIIAEKDAEIKQLKADLQSHIDGTTALVDEKIDAEFKSVDLEKDNAALTARVKELEHDLNGAKGNAKNASSNCIYWRGQTEALETQLAAAEEFIKSNRYWSDYQWELREAKP